MRSSPAKFGLATVGIVAVLAFKEFVFDPHIRPVIDEFMERKRQEEQLAAKDRDWDYSVSADGEPEFVEFKKESGEMKQNQDDEQAPESMQNSKAVDSTARSDVIFDASASAASSVDVSQQHIEEPVSMTSSIDSLAQSELSVNELSSSSQEQSYVFPSAVSQTQESLDPRTLITPLSEDSDSDVQDQSSEGELLSDMSDVQSISGLTESEMSWTDGDDDERRELAPGNKL